MANRKTPFAVSEHYHVYNRGVDKRTIFSDRQDTQRFLQSMVEFNTSDPIGSLYENSFIKLGGETPKFDKRLVNIVAYCLNPNHFHLILEQLTEKGISEFMKRLSGGYTGYFNQKNKRTGALFQGVFKDVHVDSNEYLLHLSAYVNLNDRVHQLGGETPKFGPVLIESESSWKEYTEDGDKGICKKEIILEQFVNSSEYKKFALSSLESIKERKTELKNLDIYFLE